MNSIMHEWVSIPGGLVTLTEGGYLMQTASFDVDAFAIGRYPVTNAQLGEFVAAGGYANPVWWSEIGWSLRQRNGWTEPRYWRSAQWNRPTYPAVGVSWYEALAFCRWLSAESGRTITLPTEQQWQRAAEGDNGRSYPWGDEDPHEFLCNWNRNEDTTTEVTKYPDGVSPFGVMDMSGNVWEWCLTNWENGEVGENGRAPRILRGGSWSSDSLLSLRADNRRNSDPNNKLEPSYRNHVTVGFRCVAL